MRVIADLHIHSRFARACSKALSVPNLARWGTKKGITIIGTGDFTHPKWFAELEEQLEADGDLGFYRIRPKLALDARDRDIRFLLTSELSCIYSRGGKVRRVHVLLHVPSLESVAKINAALGEISNIKADGRPILGLDAEKLTKLVLDIEPRTLIVPAHAWTPWFAVFGSKSGFDTLEECFGEMTKHIFAIETGLSSDPPMNWRLSGLDKITLMSNSDAHSLANLGREANVFELPELTYDAMVAAVKSGDPKQFLYTIEFYPEEGMYHFDGHRVCGIRWTPEETARHKGICPKCGRPVTVGVLNRVASLADRGEGAVTPNRIPFKSIIPLQEIIADALGKGKSTKGVQALYEQMVAQQPEFAILLDLDYEALMVLAPERVVEAIERVRAGKVKIEAGYDGVYGTVEIFAGDERVAKKAKTVSLFD